MGSGWEREGVPGRDRDADSGEYTTTYPDEAFLEAIRKRDGLAGTAEVAEEVGCTRRTAYTRLKAIEGNGDVAGRQVGNSLVWQVVE